MPLLERAAITIAGIVVVAVASADVFQSVVVPRPVTFLRPSKLLFTNAWPLTGQLGMRITGAERREGFYGTFAPAALIALLILWVALLVLGFGLIFYGIRGGLHPQPQSFGAAVYYAGTSLLTLGYGDIVATTGATRALSLVAAAVGLGTFAIVTAFLFALFAAFQRREAFIVSLRERIGAPPSGIEYLVRVVDLRMTDDIPETFRAAEAWMADVMETHLAYPALSYFRSTHDGQSWVATVGALLDASTLMITTVDLDHDGRAKMLNRLGRHLVNDFAQYYGFDRGEAVGIERAEFDVARAKLQAHGIALRPADDAWEAFAELRMSYAGPLNDMARYWRIPPAQWVGDRSLLRSRHSVHRPAPDRAA